MKIWTVGHRHLTRHQASSHLKQQCRVADFWPMNGSVVSMGVSVAVQYLGEGVSWTDVVGVKG